MYAQLGNIQFDVKPIEGFETAQSTEYAEHKIIEGKSRLQWTGDSLDGLTLEIRLHKAFCVPETQMKLLTDAMDAHQAMALVFGNGAYVGRFVITGIDSGLRQTDGVGNVIAMGARVTLKEWADDPLQAKQQQQKANAQGVKPAGANPGPTSQTGAAAPVVSNYQNVSLKQAVRQQ